MKSRAEFRFNQAQLSDEAYHYKACGLDNVYLLNGFTIEETDYGRGVSIDRLEDLHHAIALHIVTHRKRMSAREFKFLRKQMDMTQNDLARQLGVDSQTIARYEKGETAISGPADHLIRIIFAWSQLSDRDKEKTIASIRALIEADEPVRTSPATFRTTRRGWLAEAA